MNNYRIADVRYQVTGACNLHCPHCFSSSAQRKPEELSLEEAKNMLCDLKNNGLKLFTLTGGEPLLRRDFTLSLVEYLTSLGVRSRVFTNGTLLDQRTAGKLKENGVGEVQVSIDGMEETHDTFRGKKGCFKKAVSALEMLRDEGIRTAMRVTITPLNYLEMPEILELAKTTGVKVLRARPFISVGRGKENQGYNLTREMHRKSIGYLVKQRRNFPIQLLAPSYSFLYENIDPDTIKKLSFRACACGTRLCAITPDGWVKPCGYFSEKLGNIRDQPFNAIWNNGSNFLCKLRGITRLDPRCMACQYLPLCRGGCRASAYENTGSLEAPDPTCPRLL